MRSAPSRIAGAVTPVFFYGFDDLTRLERDAVETLARIAGAEVTVSLTYEAGRAALRARAEVVAELAPLADEVKELPARDEHYAPSARAALHHLERQLFEPAPERLDPGPAVSLLEAGGARAEAELVAGEILALLRAGVPGEEIAVVYRALGPAAALVARVFTQYGIPHQRRLRGAVRPHAARPVAPGGGPVRARSRGAGRVTCWPISGPGACSSTPRSPTGSRPRSAAGGS